jgi:hypothetical protein
MEYVVALWLSRYATNRKIECSRLDEVNAFVSIYLILPAALDPAICSAPNSNEYQGKKKRIFLGSRSRPVCKVGNFTTIYFTACYGDSFTYFFLLFNTLLWMQFHSFILNVDYGLCVNLIIYQQIWEYKI